MNENQKPEDMDKIFSEEKLDFICQYKVRSAVLRALREQFDVTEMLVIKEKIKETKTNDKTTK